MSKSCVYTVPNEMIKASTQSTSILPSTGLFRPSLPFSGPTCRLNGNSTLFYRHQNHKSSQLFAPAFGRCTSPLHHVTVTPSLRTAAESHTPITRAFASSSIADSNGSIGIAAYQGCPGAYSEQAAMKACPGLELLPCEQFEIAFLALSQWLANRAVLPIENSLGGSIHAVYDLLLRYRLHIVGETSIAVNHCLLALPGVKKSDIKRVLSHPQALAQTDGYIRSMPGVVREAVDDTAGAAQMIAQQGLRDAAAVASSRAAELYGMEILDEGIQDMKDNVTRFLVLSRDPLVIPPEADSNEYKTSIVFSLKPGSGVLFKALSVFALRDMDLTKIESRPLRDNPLITAEATGAAAGTGNSPRGFNYLFYVDFVGHMADANTQNALRHLEEIAPFLRVLGSYPRDMSL